MDLRNATHELAVKTFRDSRNPVKMLVRRQISKSSTCDVVDVGTQTFGVMFAVTCEEEKSGKHSICCKSEGTICKFNNQKRWLNPHEFAESVSFSDEGVDMNQQNSERNKNEQYDSAYDTLLTQKSSRSNRLASSNDSVEISATHSLPVLRNDDSTSGVTMRNKTSSEQTENNRLSTFYILPSSAEDLSAKEWNEVEKVVNFDYDFEYEVKESSY